MVTMPVILIAINVGFQRAFMHSTFAEHPQVANMAIMPIIPTAVNVSFQRLPCV